ncbi:zinc-dependent alcohol dehydrogenase [Paenibacillus sp. TRM 82003]|uniref:zinc-dependent alcohol dehydrogenase n=1 Tax=Kineococcus sp. TRM81007 TaxID=2925831 RepID=UPI001F5AE9BE|nr:zinc-dependent alcohol dehydrogenase [Kineococcus sp. TRM81007]MCI2238170.1 zinc-dependent alcohol dehydrogenase [Kineococcus sp. TRM81007]MCI3920554.1 zinc-dependent alcohol dehydrogenase [Paenibacillus sp. TRM 82003]
MRAAVVTEFTAPLQVREVPVPVPGPQDVLVRVEASGLCHTDIHAAHGDWPVEPAPPFVPGHEGVGVVEAVGAEVTSRRVGDRVAIAWLGSACGTCRCCVGGWETLCPEQRNSGYSVDGAFAEYAVLPAAFANPVPEGVPPLEAAPLTCAGVTTYKAVKVARVAVDVQEDKLQLAKELGADHLVNARETDPAEAVHALGGADVSIALAASPASFDQAYRALRPGGRLVCVALPADGTITLPIFDTVLQGKSVIGSIVGTRNDLADVFALHAAGRTRVVVESRPLESVDESFADVLAGRVPARVVFEP